MKHIPGRRSRSSWKEAQRTIVGGVNSPVRAFRAVGGTPIFFERGKGSKLFDVDGNAYLDYVCSWGALIHGHAYPPIVSAVEKASRKGTTFGAPTRAETELAQLIAEAFPSIERVRLVNSGTEATMSAIRLARAFTKRDLVVKFEGAYHGHADGLLVKAGSGAATLGIPSSAGVPKSYAVQTLVLPYNDAEAFRSLCRQQGRKIACVIVEPVAANMGVVLPRAGFLETLRTETRRYGIVLIFDEVITGFRFCFGSAQKLFGIKPDLTTLGKIIGGGLPLAAYGGRREIMKWVAPEGPVYQAGTLSGNPVAVAAGIAALKALQRKEVYHVLEQRSCQLEEGFRHAISEAGAQVQLNRFGSLLTLFFTATPVVDYRSVLSSDTKRYARFFWAMARQGIYLPPSQFEAMFVSLAHTPANIERTIHAAEHALTTGD